MKVCTAPKLKRRCPRRAQALRGGARGGLDPHTEVPSAGCPSFLLSSGFMAGKSSTSCKQRWRQRPRRPATPHPVRRSRESFPSPGSAGQPRLREPSKCAKELFPGGILRLKKSHTDALSGTGFVEETACFAESHSLLPDKTSSRKALPLLMLTLMLLESVRSMVKRSIPMPQPAVGGRPYSSAVQKFSSINMASSSPAAFA